MLSDPYEPRENLFVLKVARGESIGLQLATGTGGTK